MNPIRLLFKLIAEFSLMDESDYALYYEKAKEWWDSIRIDDDAEDQKSLKYKIKIWCTKWYVAVGIAFLYFPTKRMLMDMVEPPEEEEF